MQATKNFHSKLQHLSLPRSFLLNTSPSIATSSCEKFSIFAVKTKRMKDSKKRERNQRTNPQKTSAFHSYHLLKSSVRHSCDLENKRWMDHFHDNDNRSLGWIRRHWNANRTANESRRRIYFHSNHRRSR